MISGPTYIYQCPNCGNLLSNGSLGSGNTFGAQVFSDGKCIAPMLVEFPDLTKCKKCKALFWLSKLQEIGTYHLGDFPDPEWREADKARFLTIGEYTTALKTDIAENNEEELKIRLSLWRAYNDRLRKGQEIFRTEKDESIWSENVKQLLVLLDESDNSHRLLCAEINRNLGDFEKCVSLTQSVDDEHLNWIKDILLNECKRKNKWLVELQ